MLVSISFSVSLGSVSGREARAFGSPTRELSQRASEKKRQRRRWESLGWSGKSKAPVSCRPGNKNEIDGERSCTRARRNRSLTLSYRYLYSVCTRIYVSTSPSPSPQAARSFISIDPGVGDCLSRLSVARRAGRRYSSLCPSPTCFTTARRRGNQVLCYTLNTGPSSMKIKYIFTSVGVLVY